MLPSHICLLFISNTYGSLDTSYIVNLMEIAYPMQFNINKTVPNEFYDSSVDILSNYVVMGVCLQYVPPQTQIFSTQESDINTLLLNFVSV